MSSTRTIKVKAKIDLLICSSSVDLSTTLAKDLLSLSRFATLLANFVPRIHRVQCVSPLGRFSDRAIAQLAAAQQLVSSGVAKAFHPLFGWGSSRISNSHRAIGLDAALVATMHYRAGGTARYTEV